jgi:hypothetical protein
MCHWYADGGQKIGGVRLKLTLPNVQQAVLQIQSPLVSIELPPVAEV